MSRSVNSGRMSVSKLVSLAIVPPCARTARGAGLRCGLRRSFAPGVAQAHGPIEHKPIRRRIAVRAEIALPLELHGVTGIGVCQSRLDPRVTKHLNRVRIDFCGKITWV